MTPWHLLRVMCLLLACTLLFSVSASVGASGSANPPAAQTIAAENQAQTAAQETPSLLGRRQRLAAPQGDATPLPAIDTELLWSTYFGGPGDEALWLAVALDNSGGVIVAGDAGPGLPTTAGAYDPSYNGGVRDGFVARFDPTQNGGAQLVWCTYLGGGLEDAVLDLVLAGGDEDAVIVVGLTESAEFPTTPGAYDRTHNGSRDAFVARLGAGGSVLSYSTFLGGGGQDFALAVALDASLAITVGGYTESPTFPTTPGAFDTSYNVQRDAFVTRLDPSGAALVYSTFLGGSGTEGFAATDFFNIRVMDMSVDDTGAATVVGVTRSPDFPTTPGAYQIGFAGVSDGFVTRLDATGSALETSTFIGGQAGDVIGAVVLSPDGETIVGGNTVSPNFPATTGAFDETWNGSQDGCVTSFDRAGSVLTYSTYLGGSGADAVGAIALDALGDAIVVGWAGSQGFPTTPDAYDPTFNGISDAFLARVRPGGNAAADLVYSTFLGGTADDYAVALALGEPFEVTLGTCAGGGMFPTTPGAYDPTHNGGYDAAVSRMGSIGTTAIGDPEASPPAGSSLSIRLGMPRPNPSPGPVSFALEVAERSRVLARVYDVSGRLVARLMDRHLDPGSYGFSWEPEAVKGRVPPGTYFLRLDAAGAQESRKIVIAP